MRTYPLGIVGMRLVGEYDSNKSYEKLDVVTYQGSSYCAKTDVYGILPTNTTKWQLIAEKGEQGLTGNGISSVSKTGTTGLTDIYTIYFTNGTTSTFEITNGEDGEVTQEQLDETNEEVERANMVYNVLPKVSGEETDLTLDNTAECPVYEVELSPSELEQATTTGKNKCSGVRGKSSTWVSLNCDLDIQQTITLSVILDYATSDTSIYCFLDNTEVGKVGTITGNANTRQIATVTFSNEIYSQIQNVSSMHLQIYGSGLNFTSVIEPQIENGSNFTSYEPYTGGQPSPNPQYPQQIHTVSGENSVKIQNKNLFDKDTVTLNTYLQEDGTLQPTSSSDYQTSDFIPINPNTAYYKTVTGSPRTKYYDKNKQPLNTTTYQDISIGTDAGTFTTPANAYYLRATINASTVNINEVMINAGTTALSYEEHKEQTYPISLGNLEYCKIGNYEDSFVRTSGKNLFNFKSFLDYSDVTYTDDGYTYSITNVGSIVTNRYPITLKDNTTYTLSCVAIANTTSDVRVQLYKNGAFLGRILASGDSEKTYTFTTGENEIYTLNITYSGTLSTPIKISGVVLNEGTTATPYEPYDNGKWYLKKNVGKELIKFSTATLEENGIRVSSIALPIPINTYPTLHCNYFKMANNHSEAVNYSGNTPNRLGLNASGNVMCNVSGYTTTTEYINLFENNNIYVYYPVATPTYTLLSDTLQTQLDNLSKAISYQDQTNVSQTNADLPFVIKLSAIRDLSGIFDLIQ